MSQATVTPTTVAGIPATGSSIHPVRRRFGRKKFDAQPTQPASVVIATQGERFSAATIQRSVALSHGGPVAVVTPGPDLRIGPRAPESGTDAVKAGDG